MTTAKESIPQGFKRVYQGSLQRGDQVWNTARKVFEPVRRNGNVLVQQCHFVIRKTQEKTR